MNTCELGGYRLDRSTKKLVAIVLILIVTVSIGSSAWLGMPKNSVFLGIAYVDVPVVGGTLAIYDLSGNKLFEAPNATQSSGLIDVNVLWSWLWGVPQEFKIAITGGTVRGEPFEGTLTRYIQNYDQGKLYSINPLSTLVCAYKEKNPSLSYTKVEAAVGTSLEIPSGLNLDSIIDNAYSSRVFFDVLAFSDEAQANGGFNTFVNNLTTEIAQNQTHPFKGEALVGGESGGAFSSFAGALGDGAVGYFEGIALGWVMSKLGYKSPEDKQNEKIMKQLKDMSAKLDQINNKLDIVIADLTKISDQLAAIQTGLQNMEEELKKYIGEVNSYDPLAKIDSSYSDLCIYANCAPGDVSNETIDEWTAAVLDPTTGIGFAMDLLDKFNMGNVLENEDGLLQIMADSMDSALYQQTTLHYGRAYRDNIYSVYQSLTDYFQKVLFYELKGLTLISEAHHVRNETLPVKLYIENTWKPRIQNQINLYSSLVEKIVVTLGDSLEFPNMGHFPANTPQGYYKIYKNNFGNPVPSIAEIFPDIDQFTDSLMNGTGKFVLRILYGEITYPNLNPADPKPVLQSIDTGKQYQVNGELHSVPVIDRKDIVWYYRTYDLGALPAGRYKIVSPTTLSTTTDITGWVTTPPLDINEYWSFNEGIYISTFGLLSESGSTFPHIGSIQTVANDNGTVYGFWGGTWFDKSIDHGFH
jgi:hypothetical protein